MDGLVQERYNSIASAMELRLIYTNPSIWHHQTKINKDKTSHQLAKITDNAGLILGQQWFGSPYEPHKMVVVVTSTAWTLVHEFLFLLCK